LGNPESHTAACSRAILAQPEPKKNLLASRHNQFRASPGAADLGAPTPAIGGQAISRAGRPSRTAELSEAKIAQEMSSAGMISNADPMMVPPLSNA